MPRCSKCKGFGCNTCNQTGHITKAFLAQLIVDDAAQKAVAENVKEGKDPLGNAPKKVEEEPTEVMSSEEKEESRVEVIIEEEKGNTSVEDYLDNNKI